MYNTWFSFMFILWWEFGCLLHSNNNSTSKTFLKCNRRMSSAIKTFLKCNRRMSSAINTLESLARRFLQKKFFLRVKSSFWTFNLSKIDWKSWFHDIRNGLMWIVIWRYFQFRASLTRVTRWAVTEDLGLYTFITSLLLNINV